MNIPKIDLQMGQLALAQGKIELSRLLECVTEAASQGGDLREALLRRGLLTEEGIESLRHRLETMSQDQLQEAMDHGETLVMRTLHEQSVRQSQSLVDELMEPIETTATIDQVPAAISYQGQSTTGETGQTGKAEQRYEFLDELGRGGMGQILRAHDQVLNREIALKTLLPNSTVDDAQRRLVAEARLTGRLEHPSIVPIYELGHLSNGEPFYTMRVVTERSLETILQELRDEHPNAPTLLHLVQTLRQVCLAIQFAHDLGVIHRDLKPENILIGNYGEVFVIDWGIAKILSHMDEFVGPTTESGIQKGALVGTPRYMAPEQAHGLNEEVDERTDVYALGTILYEIMTLTPVFSNPTVLGLLVTIIQEEPELPSKRAPDRQIPRALEEICLRAISKDPADRYPSTQALADELELFLEGVKEKDRKIGQARQLIEEAQKRNREYDEAREQLSEALELRDELRTSTPAWAERTERQALWECEDRVEDLQVEVERQFGETVRLLSQSLSHISLPEAHLALSGLYWERFTEAENRGDRAMATYFENLVRQHDRGAYAERLRGLADLRVHCDTPQAEIALIRVQERQRRLIGEDTVSLSSAPLIMERLPHGRYQLDVKAPGFAPICLPLVLQRQVSVELDLKLWPVEVVPDDFVVVPEGSFLTGPPGEFQRERHQVHLPAFAIQRRPVSCADYVEFLNAIFDEDPDKAHRHAPRAQENSPSYFPIVDGRFIVPEEDADGDSWNPKWPICIVNHHDASAYVAWRSERDGRPYRLPSSLQWEKAARGIDGRLYPWGNYFDPSFCRMRETMPGKPLPAEVGSYPVDKSPYGVLDMAGNISEWTSTQHENSPDTYVLRGGSFNSFSLMCRLDWDLNSPSGFRLSNYGFRLVLDLVDDERKPAPSR